MPVQTGLLSPLSSAAASWAHTYYSSAAASSHRVTALPPSPLPSPSALPSDSGGSSAAASPLLSCDCPISAAAVHYAAHPSIPSPVKLVDTSPLFMSFPPQSPAPLALLPATLPPSAPNQPTTHFEQQQQHYQQQQQQQQHAHSQPSPQPAALHFPHHSSLPPHRTPPAMLPQQQHGQQRPPPQQLTHYQPQPQPQQPQHSAGLSSAAAGNASAAFPYQSAAAPFLPSGTGGQPTLPHQSPLFGNPFLNQPQPPPSRMSPQPGHASANAAVPQSNQFNFGLAGPTFGSSAGVAGAAGVPSPQSLITAQGSSYYLSHPHLSAAQQPHMQSVDESVFGRSLSPLRPVHQSLSMLPHHQQPLHGLSLASPSLLMQQAAAAVSGQPMFVHPAAHAAAGGGGGHQSLSMPSLTIQQYLNPHQQQQQQLHSTAPSFFSHSLPQHPSLPAPYSSLAAVPPSHLPSTRWHCPGGCGKVLNKRSFRSLKKHKSICILYMGWAKKNGAASKQPPAAADPASSSSSTANSSAASSGSVSRDSKRADSRQRSEVKVSKDSQQPVESEQQRQPADEGEEQAEDDQPQAGDDGTGSRGGAPGQKAAANRGTGNAGDSTSKRQRTDTQRQQQHELDVTVPVAAGGAASSLASSVSGAALSHVTPTTLTDPEPAISCVTTGPFVTAPVDQQRSSGSDASSTSASLELSPATAIVS